MILIPKTYKTILGKWKTFTPAHYKTRDIGSPILRHRLNAIFFAVYSLDFNKTFL